ncbi:MAG: FGGY family carbohydrate kinase [Saprospiraceae bacterium]|nr:FGGY family carbohydrate kinase [Saprospiraceae bacterium]
MFLIGYDIGSSSIKAALVKAETHETVAIVQSPEREMPMKAVQPGWAEQDPEMWWEHLCQATKKLLTETAVDAADIKGIGISYQMHGLVVVDAQQRVLRPSIIWCDSRAVDIGRQAFQQIGQERCLRHLLNSPGNFTASKLRWIQQNEPEIYAQIDKAMLPGDYIAMRLSGEIVTTVSGLSEGIFWDFQAEKPASMILEHYGIAPDYLPKAMPSSGLHGQVCASAAAATGLAIGTPVTYRAGDQPNNALSLNVLQPGEVAATGGTSGVVYGVVDQYLYDQASRVNGFAHVNHQPQETRIGILLCINGAGSQYRWLRQQVMASGLSYPEMEAKAAQIAVGSEGLRVLPFGNGAERMFENQPSSGQINNIQFNVHHQGHLFRAALEGIAFSFVYGMNILKEMGLQVDVIRVGNDNLFQSAVFSQTIAELMECEIEMMETTGAVGAAKASGIAVGIYDTWATAMGQNKLLKTYSPFGKKAPYQDAYQSWYKDLEKHLEY